MRELGWILCFSIYVDGFCVSRGISAFYKNSNGSDSKCYGLHFEDAQVMPATEVSFSFKILKRNKSEAANTQVL